MGRWRVGNLGFSCEKGEGTAGAGPIQDKEVKGPNPGPDTSTLLMEGRSDSTTQPVREAEAGPLLEAPWCSVTAVLPHSMGTQDRQPPLRKTGSACSSGTSDGKRKEDMGYRSKVTR